MSRQIEVAVVGQVERGLRTHHRLDLHAEAIVLGQLELQLTHHVPWVALVHVRIDVGQRDHRPFYMATPIELVKAHNATVQVMGSVHILRQFVRLSIQLELGMSNSVGHSTHQRTKVRILGIKVLGERVEAHHNVRNVAVFVRQLNRPDDGSVADDLDKGDYLIV